jgi:hypothetical protein
MLMSELTLLIFPLFDYGCFVDLQDSFSRLMHSSIITKVTSKTRHILNNLLVFTKILECVRMLFDKHDREVDLSFQSYLVKDGLTKS